MNQMLSSSKISHKQFITKPPNYNIERVFRLRYYNMLTPVYCHYKSLLSVLPKRTRLLARNAFSMWFILSIKYHR